MGNQLRAACNLFANSAMPVAVATQAVFVCLVVFLPVVAAAEQHAEVNIVHELGEAWEMFKGEDKMLAKLHQSVGRQDKAHSALARAAKAAGEATISADALGNDYNDPTDRHAADKANEKALRALQTASDEISEARHSSQKIEPSVDQHRVVKQKAAEIVRTAMDGLKALQHEALTPAAAPEVAKQEAEATAATEDLDRSARSEVDAMVKAAKEETSEREHQAANDIQQVEKSAAKRLRSEVQQATDSIDDRIRTQVNQAESHIEDKVEQQIADEIAANQVESLFDQSSKVVVQTDLKPDADAASADGAAEAASVDGAAEAASAEDEIRQNAAAEQVDGISDATTVNTKESESNIHTAKADDRNEAQDNAQDTDANAAKHRNENKPAPAAATAPASASKPWYLQAP